MRIVGDAADELERALREGLAHDLLVISGGLGPTHDDRTVELLARAAGLPLVLHEALEAKIETWTRQVAQRLRRPYKEFAAGVHKQASVPEGAVVVGLAGTAPALVLELPACVAVTLPGPPRELRALWPLALETEPLARLLARALPLERRVLRFYGVSESAVAEALAAAGGDGDGVEATICARDFEIHVDLVVEPGCRGARGRAGGGAGGAARGVRVRPRRDRRSSSSCSRSAASAASRSRRRSRARAGSWQRG